MFYSTAGLRIAIFAGNPECGLTSQAFTGNNVSNSMNEAGPPIQISFC